MTNTKPTNFKTEQEREAGWGSRKRDLHEKRRQERELRDEIRALENRK
jgi:hypothetical protein